MSSFHPSSYTVIMNRHPLSILVVVFFVSHLLGQRPLLGQTEYGKRETLVSNLNTQLAPIANETSSSETVSLDGISLMNLDGTCTTYGSGDYLELIREGQNVRVRFELEDDQRELDIPLKSHRIVCDLNDWLHHAGKAGARTDTANSRGYELACDQTPPVSATSQKYFMIDGESYSTDDFEGGLDIPWGGFRNDYYGVVMDPGETEGVIIGRQLAQVSRRGIAWAGVNDVHTRTRPVWIGKRRDETINGQDVVITELRHAHNVLEFDYRYYDQSVNPNPNATTGIVYPPTIDPSAEFYVVSDEDMAKPNKLDSIVLIFRINGYSTPACSEPSYPKPHTVAENKASIVMTAHYDGGSTWERTFKWETVGDPDANNDGLWGMYNWDAFTGIASFDIDQDGDLLFTMKDDADVEKTFYIIKLRSRKVPSEQCEQVFPKNGTFRLDDMTGNIMYDYAGVSEKLLCLDFCQTLSGDIAVANVISASAQTLGAVWSYDEDSHGQWKEEGNGADGNPYTGQPDNVYQRSEAGRWRSKQTYAYRSDIKPASNGAGTIYDNAGVFIDGANITTAFTLFNWRDQTAVDNSKWLNASTITQYAPSGEAVEEHNILDIYSTVKLAHANTVPLLAAKNAGYKAVGFNSFEEAVVNPVATWGPTFAYAHAGQTSFKLPPGASAFQPLLTLELTDQMIRDGVSARDDAEKGLLVKFWAKRTYTSVPDPEPPPVRVTIVGRVLDQYGNEVDEQVLDATGGNTAIFSQSPDDPDVTFQPQRLYKVAQTGEWSLYQLIVDNFDPLKTGTTIEVRLARNGGMSDMVWIDDLRAQPLDAQMTCYVYDRDNLRLLTQFDDQHFGVFYQYNGEGKLVRHRRETEQGLKTIAETQYNTPKSIRYEDGGVTIPIPTLLSERPKTSSSQVDGVEPLNNGISHQLAGVHIGPEGLSGSLFNADVSELPDLSSWSLPKLKTPEFSAEYLAELAPDIPAQERLSYLKELETIDSEERKLIAKSAEATTTEERNALTRRMKKLEEDRLQILQEKLGLSVEAIEALYEENDSDE